MATTDSMDRAPALHRRALRPTAPTVAEILERQGVQRRMAKAWIRRRLFNPVSRFWQLVAGRFGLDHCVPEHELVSDFFQARCTDDVVDGLHQYMKMRGATAGWSRLIHPSSAKVLRVYGRLRRRVGHSQVPAEVLEKRTVVSGRVQACPKSNG